MRRNLFLLFCELNKLCVIIHTNYAKSALRKNLTYFAINTMPLNIDNIVRVKK